MKLIDLTGKTFGNLTVIERDWEYQSYKDNIVEKLKEFIFNNIDFNEIRE